MPFLGASNVMDDEDLDDQQQQQQEPRLSRAYWYKFHISKSKLKNSSRTSALLAGFAMVALVEFDLTMPGQQSVPVHPSILVAFGVCTSLLVSVHLLALMMSVCALPHMDAIHGTTDLKLSPHERLRGAIELAWLFSTVIGLLLFLIEVGLICWIKFMAIHLPIASYATAGVLVPVVIIFIVFTRRFYYLLYKHRRNLVDQNFNDLYKSYECLTKTSGNKQAILREVDETRRSYLYLQDAIAANLIAIERGNIEVLRKTPTVARFVPPSPTIIPSIFVDGRPSTPVTV